MRRTNAKLAAIVAGLSTAVFILALAACSGSGGGGFNLPQPKRGSQQQTTVTANIPFSTVGTAVTLPAVGDFTQSVTLPANNNHSATLHLILSTVVPGAMPAMAPDMHVARPYVYITLSTSQTVTLQGFPGFTFGIPPSVLGSPPVKLGYYDPAKGWQHVGDMTQNGNTWTFAATSTPVVLTANTTYYAVPYTCTGASTTVPIIAGSTIHIPAIGGISGEFTVPPNNAPSGTTETLTTFDKMPPGAPQPQAMANSGIHLFTLRPPVNAWVSFTYSRSGTQLAANSFDFQSYPATTWDLPSGAIRAGMSFFLETFDGTTGMLLTKEAASSVSSTTVTFPGVPKTFTATFGHIYWWELISTPSVSEFTLPAGTGPADIKEGPDGNLWFGEINARSNLGRITPTGTLTEFPLPINGTFVRRLTVGPDGNIWFTIGPVPGEVGRITTAGVMTIFPLPTRASVPVGITTGSDNNLWVIESRSAKLARVTTNGTITEFPTFTALGDPEPFGVVTGADGNLWVTLLSSNEIARVDISTQAVTRFPIPTPSSLPNYIISHGRSLYFEENGANKIGIISTTGAITEKTLVHPLPPSYPGWLTTGPDGNVWFTDQGASEIGSIVGGTIVEFPIPTPNSTPIGITSGPGNTIWFTEFSTDKIGTFTVP